MDEIADSTDAIPQEEQPCKLHVANLDNVASISTLGLVVARMLQQNPVIALQVSTTGYIEVVPVDELLLDNCSESTALDVLINKGYTDTQLAAFLSSRESRLQRNKENG